MHRVPKIRSGLLTHKLDDQLLVYVSESDEVHLLDSTTAAVFELLSEQGWTDVGLVVELRARLGSDVDEDLVLLALEQLRAVRLLDEVADSAPRVLEPTRREALRKLAMAGGSALLIPAIATLTASPTYAATTGPSGASVACDACATSSQCVAGVNCINGRCGGNPGTVNGGACASGTAGRHADATCCTGFCTCNGGGNNCACST